ncbi:MAG: phosphate propanoyltransferase [Proteocatella sp.]
MNTENIVNQITELVLAEIKKIQAKEHLIPVGISARHLHLTQEQVEILFGKGHQLTFLKPLSQTGQFAAQETVTLQGPKGSIEKVRILGPVRSHVQVEVSMTDARSLGLNPPVRESGKLENTPGITIKGPKGQIDVANGVIVAQRHAHMSLEDAENFGLSDGDYIRVFVEGTNGGTMEPVMVRVNKNYVLDLHLDTDNSNAFGLSQGQKLRFEKIK